MVIHTFPEACGLWSHGALGRYAPDESNQGGGHMIPSKYASDEIRNNIVTARDEKSSHEGVGDRRQN